MSWINFCVVNLHKSWKGFSNADLFMDTISTRATYGIGDVREVAEEEVQKMPRTGRGHRYGRELAYLAGICSST